VPQAGAGLGGWVPEIRAAPEPDDTQEDDLFARWAPPGGRHRTPDPEPDRQPGGDPRAASPGIGAPGPDPKTPLRPADEPADQAIPDIGPPPDDSDDPDGATRPRRYRINGRWGRFAELWVPEPLRNARLDPGRRGMIVLILVAAMAAVATAIGVWRDRPEPRPIETSVVAAVSEVSASPSGIVAPSSSGSTTTAPTVGEILVSVTGLVVNPGVVRLPVDSRVADAISSAGGTQPGADLTGMNLAAKLADGDSVVVADTPAPAAASSPQGQVGAGSTGSAAGAAGLVNLNTADEAALDTLPGVGPVMAQNIIAWRETNGTFTSIEQLQEISGIGPSRYAQIAALVTVD
jgi:competence protein ComEA